MWIWNPSHRQSQRMEYWQDMSRFVGCLACLSDRHRTEDGCYHLKEKRRRTRRGSRTCPYPRCEGEDHVLLGCPVLHMKCVRCWSRGHHRRQCRSHRMEEHRDVFEDFADGGRFTRDRRRIPGWGFFTFKYYSEALYHRYDRTLVYNDLLERNPKVAARMISENRRLLSTLPSLEENDRKPRSRASTRRHRRSVLAADYAAKNRDGR